MSSFQVPVFGVVYVDGNSDGEGEFNSLHRTQDEARHAAAEVARKRWPVVFAPPSFDLAGMSDTEVIEAFQDGAGDGSASLDVEAFWVDARLVGHVMRAYLDWLSD